ncbi:MAG: Do family serine endopeptidase [Phycisphaerae bacterium]
MKILRRWMPVLLSALIVIGGLLALPAVTQELTRAAERGEALAARERLAEMGGHDRLSELFRTVSKAVKPSVVEVRVIKRVEGSAVPFMDEDLLRRFFGDDVPFEIPQPRQREYLQRGLGSGVIVDAAKGYVLTNSHVVRNADEVEIVLYDQRSFEAQWVRTDPKTDLAVLKIDADDLIDAPLGDSDEMAVGDWVLAIGSPHRLPQTVTAGIISAKGRSTNPELYQNFLQTDAAINPGNSGGPLVNMAGEVIGINTAIVSQTGVNEGIGLAIPSNMARRIMDQLIETGEVVRGFLGVYLQDVSQELAESFGFPTHEGALVTEIMEDSPAEEADFREQDFIMAVDGEPVKSVNELRNRVAALRPGQTVPFTVYRNGETIELEVTIGRLEEEDMPQARAEDDEEMLEELGLEVQTLTRELARRLGYDEDLRGVVITNVRPASDAAEQGLSTGMVITHVNDQAVTDVDEFAEAVGERPGVRLRVRTPEGRRLYVFLRRQ